MIQKADRFNLMIIIIPIHLSLLNLICPASQEQFLFNLITLGTAFVRPFQMRTMLKTSGHPCWKKIYSIFVGKGNMALSCKILSLPRDLFLCSRCYRQRILVKSYSSKSINPWLSKDHADEVSIDVGKE